MANNFPNIVSAHGSWCVVQATINNVVGYFLLDNTSVDANVTVVTSDVTHSGSGGWTHDLAHLKRVEEITVQADYDAVADIEVQGLPLCQNVILYVKRGTLNKYDAYSDCKFMAVQTTQNNQNGEPIKRTYRFKGGSLASNINPPSGVQSFLAALTPPRPFA